MLIRSLRLPAAAVLVSTGLIVACTTSTPDAGQLTGSSNEGAPSAPSEGLPSAGWPTVGSSSPSASSSSGGADASTSGASSGSPDASSSSSGGSSSSSGGSSSSSGGSSGGVTPTGEVRAFPGAEGFGARVTGGRGGKVVTVTTLAASGAGSLQAALDASGPRIIVFAVSGVISAPGGGNTMITISKGDVTIAGQTAPGAGITIRGQFFTDYGSPPSNIIVRHIRVRPAYDGSDAAQFDAIQFSRAHHFILDHVSASGAADETVDAYEAHDATVQWSAIESSELVTQPGDNFTHNYGLINGPDGARFSVHHTLFAHQRVRSPAIANGPAEVINNVVYNGLRGFVHNNPATGSFNMIGNVFKDGPSSALAAFYFDAENGTDPTLHYFLSGNVAQGSGDCTAGPVDDPWSTCSITQDVSPSTKASKRYDFTGDAFRAVTASSAADAYTAVLARAGAFPRDFITKRSVDEATAGTGAYGSRYTTSSNFLTGLTPGATPTDADGDGIADAWEASHGLSSSSSTDGSTVLSSGYSAIETYINELADALAP